MRMQFLGRATLFALAAVVGVGSWATGSARAGEEFKLLNVSYDPTRELYKEFNEVFAKYYREKTGNTVTITQSHAGSTAQANAVIQGNEADVLTLALAYDIDEVVNKTKANGKQLLPENWQSRLPKNSAPYTSTIVFLVRVGNPKNIKDWNDLTRSDVKTITPDPKTSGGARWNYLAAWAYALANNGNDDAKAREFVKQIYANVPVLDSGARGATNTFVQKGQGDVLLAWENEAYLSINDVAKGKVEIVVPSLSIRAEPTVTWVDKNVERHGTTEVAKEYLNYLYSKEGQRIAGKNYYRPSDPEVGKEFTDTLPELKLVTIDDDFGGWAKAYARHFADGAEFDQIITELHKK
ncbi:sulfate transporter subunit [Planctomycetales bacterium]|nr:sulfate transporter subunit [Planctomycetales bacterium]GHS99550.1 sulfate transporter subunit [Planctomycetales bacterium]GHT07623.1 sulfate transporter subunit [Planctomycetales bacterium]